MERPINMRKENIQTRTRKKSQKRSNDDLNGEADIKISNDFLNRYSTQKTPITSGNDKYMISGMGFDDRSFDFLHKITKTSNHTNNSLNVSPFSSDSKYSLLTTNSYGTSNNNLFGSNLKFPNYQAD